MCSFVNRLRAAAVAAALGAAIVVAVVRAGYAGAGPVSSLTNPAVKIEEIEKAAVALQRGQTDEANRLLGEAVKKYPYLPPARLMLARLYLYSSTNDGQKQGRAVLEQAAAENSDHPQVFLTLGNVALLDGRIAEALLDCQKALDLSAADRWTADQKKVIRHDAHKLLTAACEVRQDWANARTHLVTLLESDAKNGPLRQRLARALFFLDKPNDAYKELTAAVKDDATLEPAAVTMGQLWAGKGESKLARDWLDQAVKAEPNSIRVQLAYAKWLLEQNDIEPAKVHLDTAAKFRPDDTDVLKLQGLVARIKKDFAAAEKVFRRLTTDTPDDFFASNQLALTLADQSENDQRKRALQYATVNARQYAHTPDPRAVEALATLGYVSYRNNNLEDAWQSIQAATAGGQASSDTAYFLALLLAERDKNKAGDAKKILKTALDSRGLFVYRKDAQTLHDKLDKNK